MARAIRGHIEELAPDNGARLAVFDALTAAARDDPEGTEGLTAVELTDRIIGRLRVLVPQELHVMGEQEYVNSKLAVCLDAGIIQRSPSQPERLVLGATIPLVRYPDGSVRGYTARLEAARERLDADEFRLRRAGFNIRHMVKSASTRRKSDSFRRLAASMREHGFLVQFPLIESATAGVIDGLARQAAAAESGIVLKKQHMVRLPKRRDTLLHHALLVLDVNAERLTEEDHLNVHETIAARVQRPWIKIEIDLELTREWRRTEPKEYDAKLEVEVFPYTRHEEPKVQVTTDRTRVMLRSLMQQAGVPEYQRDLLKPFVAMEDARTQYSGRKAIFVDIDDAIDGIAKMQGARTRRGLKADRAWDEMREWLIDTFRPPRAAHDSARKDPSRDIGELQV